MESEARLSIARTAPEDVKQRQIIVKLDGEWIGDLLYGRTLSLDIQPGRHTLRVDNTWNKKTIEFDVSPGEQVKFRTVNRAGGCTWFLVASIGAGPMYVSIEREAEAEAPNPAPGS
ncbi:MAG TPA: hypothetical protein VEV17_01550 [Bryobacteraceae bacterium]|nr:hypothetical protein [Bryobacteraceae bacterium]